MAFILTVLLLTTGALSCINAQEAYNKLTEPYRKGVDLALEQLNSHPTTRHHFLFFKSLSTSNIDISFGVNFFHHNFYLKATTCAKGTVTADATKCPFRNDRPLIDCVACYNMFNGNIEPDPKPYIHCIHKPSLKEEAKKRRNNHCQNMNHLSGGGTLLAQKSP